MKKVGYADSTLTETLMKYKGFRMSYNKTENGRVSIESFFESKGFWRSDNKTKNLLK